jgi:hypothetical protein
MLRPVAGRAPASIRHGTAARPMLAGLERPAPATRIIATTATPRPATGRTPTSVLPHGINSGQPASMSPAATSGAQSFQNIGGMWISAPTGQSVAQPQGIADRVPQKPGYDSSSPSHHSPVPAMKPAKPQDVPAPDGKKAARDHCKKIDYTSLPRADGEQVPNQKPGSAEASGPNANKLGARDSHSGSSSKPAKQTTGKNGLASMKDAAGLTSKVRRQAARDNKRPSLFRRIVGVDRKDQLTT